jgi:uncharacterized hydrophobic protein (TIGR00271 family)
MEGVNNNNQEKQTGLISQLGTLISGTFQLLRETLRFNDENINHEEVRNNIIKDISFRGYNVWILICSIVICSIGLNINSTAVVIGAMLISPLMGPILGLGLSIGTNDLENLKASIRNFLIALGVSLLTSTVFFLITPLHEAQSELLARTQPTFLDALIAVFGGLAGIIAVSRKDTSNVIPGVAIATALMPPICTAGYGLANGNMHFFLGALYLFLLNSVFISIATLIIVRYLHFPFISFVDTATEKRVKRYIVIISSIIIIPSAYLFIEVTQESIFHSRAELFTQNTFTYQGSEVINQKSTYNKEGSTIEVFMIGTQIPDEVIWAWEQELKKSDLKNTSLKVVQNKDNSEEIAGTIGEQVKAGIIEELYHKNYQDLQDKNKLIDSLNTEITNLKGIPINWTQLQKEIFIQYPDLLQLSFGKSIQLSTNQIDTIPTLITYWNNVDKSEQLKNWLEVRMGENEIQVINQK